jgi:hypothetical protein
MKTQFRLAAASATLLALGALGAVTCNPATAGDRSIYYDNSKGTEDRTVTIDRGSAGQRNVTVKAGEGAEIKYRSGDHLSERSAKDAPGGRGQPIKDPYK